MFSALRTVVSRFMSMCLVAPLLLTVSNALSSRPASLSLLTHNEFVDHFNPTHNLENFKDQSHDEIEKEIKEWITDKVSIIKEPKDTDRTVSYFLTLKNMKLIYYNTILCILAFGRVESINERTCKEDSTQTTKFRRKPSGLARNDVALIQAQAKGRITC